MLGNAMIQPMMYFNLRYVPMFSGPYMITKVTHRINDSGFDTSFEGQRQPFYSIPALDKYLQSLSNKILTSLKQKIQEEDTRLSETPENVTTEKNSSVSYATSGIGGISTQSCSANLVREYETYVNITPTPTTETFGNVNKLLREKINTKGLDPERSDLLRAFIFSTIYIGSFNSQNFKTVENNYSAIPLNINWGGSNAYFEPEYFCVDQGKNLKVPMAKFSSLDKFLDFMVNKYKDKLGAIENYLDRTATTTEQKDTAIINAVTKAYILDFPKNKSTKVYDEMVDSDKETIKEKITKSYNLLISL
jgi:hypothetical protein